MFRLPKLSSQVCHQQLKEKKLSDAVTRRRLLHPLLFLYDTAQSSGFKVRDATLLVSWSRPWSRIQNLAALFDAVYREFILSAS